MSLTNIIARADVNVRWPQTQQVPLGGFYNIYQDGDYSVPINSQPVAAWPNGQGKIGFGLGQFGMGYFGYNGVDPVNRHAGPGFGIGMFGMGYFGIGALPMNFVARDVLDGERTFAVVGFDAVGNPVTPPSGTNDTKIVAGIPRPPEGLEAASYNNGTGELTLTITLSPDDT